MARVLSRAVIAISANTAEFEKGMKRVTRNLQRQRRQFNQYAKVAATAFAAVTTAAVTAGLKQADSLAKTADKLGLTTEALAGLRHAAEQYSGMASRQFDTALQRMVRRVAEAAQGTGEAQGAIRELGLDAVELAKLSPDQQFFAIADAMSAVKNQSDRVRLSFKLFDSEGVGVVNTLMKGSEGLRQMREDAERLGIALDREAAAKAEMAVDAFDRLQKVGGGLTQALAVEMAPVLTAIADRLVDVAAESGGFGDVAGKAIRHVATAVGFLADGLHAVHIIISGLTAAWATFASYVLRALSEIDQQLVNVANKFIEVRNLIPGTEAMPLIETEYRLLERHAEAMAQTAADLREKTHDLVMGALPSAQLRAELDKIFAEADAKAAEIARKASGGAVPVGDGLSFIDVPNIQRRGAKKTAEKATAEAEKQFSTMAMTVENAFSNIFAGVEVNFGSMLRRMAADLISSQLMQLLRGSFGSILGGIFGGSPAPGAGGVGPAMPAPRALGGPVTAGSPYIVGEKGPELFVPRNSGSIVPNDRMGGSVNFSQTIVIEGDATERTAELLGFAGQSIKADTIAEIMRMKSKGRL